MAGDRLSGCVEIFTAPHGAASAGAQDLIAALRALFAMFGVPEEIYSGYRRLSNRMLTMNNDGLLCALLQACNTPDPDCNNQHRWYLAGPFAMLFFLHQPMHQVQQPIDPSRVARGVIPKGGRYANKDTALYRSPRHAYVHDFVHLYRSATKYSCKTNVVHILRNGTNRVLLRSWATTTNTE